MSFFATASPSPIEQKQSRLMQLAAFFLFVYSIILSLAPAVRLHSWQVDYRWNHWIGFLVWLVGSALVHHQLARRLPERDPFFFPIASLLTGWGLLTVWRLDAVMGMRQTAWLGVSLLVFAAGLRMPNLLGFLRRYKYLWLTTGLLITALTFLLGTYPGGVGPRLWLGCCGVYLQPSEPLKLLLIIYLAAYLADRLPVSFSLAELLAPTLVLIGAALVLLIGQRDLGTASLFILIYTVVVYVSSQRKRVLFISLFVLIAAGLIGYLLFDVVRVRVDAWINPWVDPAGRSYQIIQSIIAVASGQFLGRGPGIGNPGVVPVSHSDFIFASIAEENGLLGAAGLFILYALFVQRGFRAALFAATNYLRYLAAGITAYIVMQGIFIAGGNLRLLPLTGVTLPFVSYGGSSLLTSYIALLILELISQRREEDPAPLPRQTPYLLVSGALLLGLLALAVTTGWWALARSDALMARPENPRRVIGDRYVRRGSLLDRNNKPIDQTAGEPGSFTRAYAYPPLSNTTGYNSPRYGLAGLEAGLDGYLRGLRGNPTSLIWTDDLLYGQPPPGLNVRLTVDLDIQKQADALLNGHRGALVLLNARTGEILAIASHPNFDPNTLDENWSNLLQDPDAPLLNRATQGQYSPGQALGPFLLAYSSTLGALPAFSNALTYPSAQGTLTCAIPPQPPLDAGALVTNGCPAPLAAMGRQLGVEGLSNLFTSLGFYESPNLLLQTAPPSQRSVNDPVQAALGQENMTVTPLQMALAAAALSNNGVRPAPQLAAGVLTPQQGWQPFSHGEGQKTPLAPETTQVLETLAPGKTQYWHTVALAQSNKEQQLTWFLAGTLPQWQGTPLALALVLEENNPQQAVQIGQSLLNNASK